MPVFHRPLYNGIWTSVSTLGSLANTCADKTNMNDLGDQALMDLLQMGESEQVEFKESFTGNARRTIRETICAFANDMAGTGKTGVVFIGIGDNGDIIGTQVTDELLRNLADMKYDGRITPVPSLTVQKKNFLRQGCGRHSGTAKRFSACAV